MVRVATAQIHVRNKEAQLGYRMLIAGIVLVLVLTFTTAVAWEAGVLVLVHTAGCLVSLVGLQHAVRVAVGVWAATRTTVRLRVCIMRILVVV